MRHIHVYEHYVDVWAKVLHTCRIIADSLKIRTALWNCFVKEPTNHSVNLIRVYLVRTSRQLTIIYREEQVHEQQFLRQRNVLPWTTWYMHGSQWEKDRSVQNYRFPSLLMHFPSLYIDKMIRVATIWRLWTLYEFCIFQILCILLFQFIDTVENCT